MSLEVDLVIRGGTVVDGSGGAPYTGDVAVDNGIIVGIGDIAARGREEIDAAGLLVSPGWVDVHTHYDGQVTWDSRVTPSSLHGVTTVVMGNCGVGFAPVRGNDHDTLVRLMEGVEDIPGAALHEGLTWDWESFPDYLDAIEARPHDIDIAAQVPHGALRVYVMGERGAKLEPANPDDIDEMGRLAREAVEAGALGFTTSRTMLHRTSDGAPTPTLKASRDELVGIAAELGKSKRGVLQVVSDLADIDDEFETFREMVSASGRPFSISIAQNDVHPDAWRDALGRLGQANRDGLPMKGQVAARPVGLLLGLQGSVHPFIAHPSYRKIAELPLGERVEVMRDPAFKRRLLLEEPVGSPNSFSQFVARSYEKMFRLGDPPNYEPAPDESLAAQAEREGKDAQELAYDILLENDGCEFIFFPFLNYAGFTLDPVLEMMRDANTIPGLSDGGAHCGVISDASFPTYLITHWARDRSRGERADLPWLVKTQTRDTAEAVGLCDRGLIAPGMKADLNVIDFERLQVRPPHMVYDLPANARRLMQRADGYVATVVSGEIIYRDGQPTGALPGKLVRGPQPEPVVRAAE